MSSTTRPYTRPEDAIYQPLTVDGAPDSAFNLVGNYSVTPVSVFFQATEPCILKRMIIYLQDTGSIDAGGYGNGPALTNGISVKIVESDDTPVLDFLPQGNVLTNGDWVSICYDGDVKSWGVGDEVLPIRWTFKRDNSGLILSGGRKLVVTANDDLTVLVRHQFLIRGEWI